MKKLLISGLLFMGTFSAMAQNNQTFKLGLTAHPNIGWIKSDISGVENDGARFGFTYGLLGDFLFAENYAFSTGLSLSTINGQITGTSVGNGNSSASSDAKSTLKLQYLEIPAKIKLLTNENNGIRFFGEFGLGNAFNVRAKEDYKTLNSADNTENADIYDDIAFYRGSIVIGGGAEISTSGKTKIMAGLSFDNGFTDIKKGSGTLKSAYLGLNIGVFF